MSAIGEDAIGALAISEGAAAGFGAGTFEIGAHVLVAVEFDFYDTVAAAVKTLRLCNRGPLVAQREPASGPDWGRRLFLPGLVTPIQLGARIEAENYGAPRGAANGGTIEFAIDETIRPYLAYACMGREFRLYQGPWPDLGDVNDRITSWPDLWATMELVYVGRIAGLAHNTVMARVTTTDARLDLDEPVIDDLYDSDIDSVPLALQGLCKPHLWGEAYSLEPVAVDPVAHVYEVTTTGFDPSAGPPFLSVRIGGIAWTEVPSSPTPGQYSVNTALGRFTLGGTPEGGEIRVIARAPGGYLSFATDDLIRDLVVNKGGAVDEVSLGELDPSIGPGIHRVSYFLQTAPVNAQDALDEIMAGLFGWWCATPLGLIAAGVIRAPVAPPVIILTEVEIESIELVITVPPVHRVRVEYQRNWFPETQWFSAVDESSQQEGEAAGLIAPEWSDPTIKDIHPKAIDLPLIRSLMMSESDALLIRDGAAAAASVERRVWNVAARLPLHPALYSVVEIDYRGPYGAGESRSDAPVLVSGLYRVTSVIRAFGGGPSTLVLWG